jgi:hypothetical protein
MRDICSYMQSICLPGHRSDAARSMPPFQASGTSGELDAINSNSFLSLSCRARYRVEVDRLPQVRTPPHPANTLLLSVQKRPSAKLAKAPQRHQPGAGYRLSRARSSSDQPSMTSAGAPLCAADCSKMSEEMAETKPKVEEQAQPISIKVKDQDGGEVRQPWVWLCLPSCFLLDKTSTTVGTALCIQQPARSCQAFTH